MLPVSYPGKDILQMHLKSAPSFLVNEKIQLRIVLGSWDCVTNEFLLT